MAQKAMMGHKDPSQSPETDGLDLLVLARSVPGGSCWAPCVHPLTLKHCAIHSSQISLPSSGA